MKSFASRVISSSISLYLMATAFVAVLFVLMQLDGVLRKDLDDLHVLRLSAEQVLNLDNDGTTGIRLAASLRSDHYIQTYQDLQDKKYEVLNVFYDHSQRDAVRDIFFSMAEIQEELEELEAEAIGLIDEQSWDEAWQLVTDPDFIERKEDYRRNLSEVLQTIIIASEQKIAQSNRLTDITRYCVGVIFIFLCLVAYGNSRAIRRSLQKEQQLTRSLEEFNETLEHRVKVRTEELDKANRIKDEFLASISHELRTPLTAIIGNAEILSDRLQDAELKDIVDSIQSAGRVQLNLVSDILDISKIESGLFTIEEMSFDLSDLLRDIRVLFQDRAQDAGLNLKIEQLNVETHQLLGDPNRIRQVLINLVGNAIKFTEEGTVTLTSRVDDGQLLFSVEDSGIGMTKQEQQRLFKKFQQVDGSISRRFGGSGLGLYISLNLANLMGGALTVSSEKNRGSEFTFSLPYRPSNKLIARPQVELDHEDDSVRFSGSVLVVEDTLPIQMIVRRLLESMGVAVNLASNGKEALEWLEESAFDLIFMDMQMPVMDGIEATRIIREQGIETPLYALTANVFSQDRENFKAAGSDGFLTKPVAKKELRAVLARHLEPQPDVETANLDS